MDLVKIAQDFGAYAAFAVFFGWWLKSSLTDRIAALENSNAEFKREVFDLNRYIREEQAEIISDGHIREREFVTIIKELRHARGELEPTPAPAPAPAPAPVPPKELSEEDTQKILAEVASKHGKTPRGGSKIVRGISGMP